MKSAHLLIILIGLTFCYPSYSSQKHSRFHKSRKGLHSHIVKHPIVSNCSRREREWIYSDFWWLTEGSFHNIDYLWDVSTFPVAKIDPDFSMFMSSFEGMLFKPWDGWSKSIVTNYDYMFTCNHNSDGNMTEYFVEDDCKITLAYNPNGTVKEILWYKMDSKYHQQWDDMDKMTYTYNSNGVLTDILTEWGDPVTGEIWGKEKESFEYNAQENRTAAIYSYFDENTNTFAPGQKDGYSYNSSNQLIGWSYYEWDVSTGTWGPEEFPTSYSYDQNGFLSLRLSEGDDSTAYTNDANGNLLETVSYGWDDGSGAWEAGSKEIQTFNGNGNPESVVCFAWDTDSGAWEPLYKWAFKYTAENNLDEIQMTNWDSETNSYKNSDKYVCIYNKDNNPEKYIMYCFEESTNNFEIDEEYTIAFEYNNAINPNNCISLKEKGIQYSVNSQSVHLSVSVDGKWSPGDEVKLYTIQGKMIAQLHSSKMHDKTVYNLDLNGNKNNIGAQMCILMIKKENTIISHRFMKME